MANTTLVQTKACPRCGEIKDVEAFAMRSDKPHLRCSHCRSCVAAKMRSNRARPDFHATRKRRILTGYKLVFGCVDCGYATDPARLHLDHRPGTEKLFEPSACDRPLSVLLTEWAKCEVRCGSCHRKRHWRAGDYEGVRHRER
jgi:hypothetical protein